MGSGCCTTHALEAKTREVVGSNPARFLAVFLLFRSFLDSFYMSSVLNQGPLKRDLVIMGQKNRISSCATWVETSPMLAQNGNLKKVSELFYSTNKAAPRTEPGMAGCEAQTLPLCYIFPKTFLLFCSNRLPLMSAKWVLSAIKLFTVNFIF